MGKTLRWGVIALVAGGVCALALGVGLRAGPARSQASGQAASNRQAARPRPATSGPGGGTETSAPGAVKAIDPALFSPGACMAFPPASGNRHETVFLDAGHGGLDPGGVGSTETGVTVKESTVNLAIELDATAILRAHGYRVVVSRTQNTTVTRLTPGDVDGSLLTVQGVHNDIVARDVCANLAKASVLVGIYMNAGVSGSAGCLTAYDASRPFAAGNLRLATLVQEDVLGAMNAQGWQIPDDGVRADTGLGSSLSAADRAYHHLLLLGPAKAGYFDTPSQMPGALTEPLFLTDPFEASIAVGPHGQQVIAQALATAIERYLTGS